MLRRGNVIIYNQECVYIFFHGEYLDDNDDDDDGGH